MIHVVCVRACVCVCYFLVASTWHIFRKRLCNWKYNIFTILFLLLLLLELVLQISYTFFSMNEKNERQKKRKKMKLQLKRSTYHFESLKHTQKIDENHAHQIMLQAQISSTKHEKCLVQVLLSWYTVHCAHSVFVWFKRMRISPLNEMVLHEHEQSLVLSNLDEIKCD